MTTFALWVLILAGAAATALALGLAYIFAIDAFRDWRHTPHYRSFYEGGEHARNKLAADSWWFSESPETQELLADLARGKDVSEAREKWRRSRAVDVGELAKSGAK